MGVIPMGEHYKSIFLSVIILADNSRLSLSRLKEEKQIQDAIPENVATEKDHVISNTDIPETKKARPEPEDVISFLKKKNVKFIDKRDRNGALWIVGGKELSPIINECKKFGVFFHFKEDGGRQTDFRPGWWAK